MPTTITNVFVVQHKATKLCMPIMDRGGYTWWEPLLHDHSKELPRIFFSKVGAERAIAAWAKGEWKRHTGVDYSCGAFGEGFDYTEQRQPKIARAKSDLEVLPLQLVECHS